MPKVQERGQVTLPRALRERLGIRPGDEVNERVVEPGDVIDEPGILVTPSRPGFSRFRGILGRASSSEVLEDLRDG